MAAGLCSLLRGEAVIILLRAPSRRMGRLSGRPVRRVVTLFGGFPRNDHDELSASIEHFGAHRLSRAGDGSKLLDAEAGALRSLPGIAHASRERGQRWPGALRNIRDGFRHADIDPRRGLAAVEQHIDVPNKMIEAAHDDDMIDAGKIDLENIRLLNIESPSSRKGDGTRIQFDSVVGDRTGIKELPAQCSRAATEIEDPGTGFDRRHHRIEASRVSLVKGKHQQIISPWETVDGVPGQMVRIVHRSSRPATFHRNRMSWTK